MNINYNFCCKKFRRYTEECGYDFAFSIKKGKFHWGDIQHDNYEGDKMDEETFYMEYCPFCGERVIVNK